MKSLKAELNMGGLVGNLYGTVENSYATGTVKVEAGSGYTAVGGFIGQTKNTAAITNSYAAGTVTGSAGGALGAFVGVNSGSISGSYYREDAAEAAVATGADGLTAMTVFSCRAMASSRIISVWSVIMSTPTASTAGYPIHAWQGRQRSGTDRGRKRQSRSTFARLSSKTQNRRRLYRSFARRCRRDEFGIAEILEYVPTYIPRRLGYDCGVLPRRRTQSHTSISSSAKKKKPSIWKNTASRST